MEVGEAEDVGHHDFLGRHGPLMTCQSLLEADQAVRHQQ